MSMVGLFQLESMTDAALSVSRHSQKYSRVLWQKGDGRGDSTRDMTGEWGYQAAAVADLVRFQQLLVISIGTLHMGTDE